MKELLQNIYGSCLELYCEKKVRLPLYLTENRCFYDVTLCNLEFVLVHFQKQERLNVATLKKQSKKYNDTFQKEIVYGFPMITTSQRKSLIENNIAFIAENEQIFLPFIGIYFSKCIKNLQIYEMKHLMPASQMLYLLLLYSNQNCRYNRSQAANILSLTIMSVTRAAKQLKELNVLAEEKKGTEVYMYLCTDKRKSFEQLERYFINPVQSICYVNADSYNHKIRAGEFSLSQRSDFGYSDYEEYAICKTSDICNQLETFNPELEVDKKLIKIQKWKYDPKLFCKGQDVDPVSLICTFKENRDERIHKCLEQIKGEIDEWQIIMN